KRGGNARRVACIERRVRERDAEGPICRSDVLGHSLLDVRAASRPSGWGEIIQLTITAPPATSRITPVIQLLYYEASKRAAHATSSGLPRRLMRCISIKVLICASGIRC